jgi:hypothetical protein
MKSTHLAAMTLSLALGAMTAMAGAPQVNQVSATQRAAEPVVDVRYDVYDAEGDALNVQMLVSTNAGTGYQITTPHTSGDIGAAVQPGTNKHIMPGAWRGFCT